MDFTIFLDGFPASMMQTFLILIHEMVSGQKYYFLQNKAKQRVLVLSLSSDQNFHFVFANPIKIYNKMPNHFFWKINVLATFKAIFWSEL